jgi:hypothetical protein
MTTETRPHFERGQAVVVTDFRGNTHRMVALSDVEEKGHDFPVVWVSEPDQETRIPWPAESVTPEETG